MNTLNNIFISGATHGIGKATTELFCKKGWHVYGCASNDKDLRGYHLLQEYPNFHFYITDVSKEEAVLDMFQKMPEISVCFNNAGIGCVPHLIDEMNYMDALKILQVNLLGVGLCMKYGIRKNPTLIINNASISAFQTKTGCDPFYSASKAGVIALTKECASEEKYHQITFCSLSPGYIKTRMTATDQKDSSIQWLEPSIVAEYVWKLATGGLKIQSGENIIIQGHK